MKVVSHPHGRATISTGGAANGVSVPPIETFTKSRPRVAYFNLRLGRRSKNCRASSSAQIVIAAGSVMKDPISGPTIRIDAHHAAGVAPPAAATPRHPASPHATRGLGSAHA